MTRRQQKVNCQCCNFSVHLNENYLDHLGRKLHPTCFIRFRNWSKK